MIWESKYNGKATYTAKFKKTSLIGSANLEIEIEILNLETKTNVWCCA